MLQTLKYVVSGIGLACAVTMGAHATALDFSGVQGSHSATVAVPGSGGGTGATINHAASGTILVGSGSAG